MTANTPATKSTPAAISQDPNVPVFQTRKEIVQKTNSDGATVDLTEREITLVTVNGVTMREEEFRAARAGLVAGVGNPDEQHQLRGTFGLKHLQKRAYQISDDHGFHETDQWLDGMIAEANFNADNNRDFVIPAEHVGEFITRLQELRDAYRGNRLMLIAGEVTEAHEELRSGHAVDEVYFPTQVEVVDGEEREVPGKKPEGVPAELADVMIRVLDTAEAWGIDLDYEVPRKMAFNETRPAKHGRRF